MRRRGLVVVAGLSALAAVSLCGSCGDVFSDARLGYSIEVPTGWVVTRPDVYEVRFGGPLGVYMKIQNVASSGHGGLYDDVASLVASLKCQLAMGADTLSIYGAGAFRVTDADGTPLEGWQYLTSYPYAGVEVREWYGVVGRAPGDVFYVVSYTATAEAYSSYEQEVIASLRTWVVAGVSETSGTAASGTSVGASDIVVILQDRGHIGPYHYEDSTYDKRYYEFTASAAGYIALCVVDQAAEAVTGWIFAADGTQVTVKPGNYSDVYTSSCAVEPGTYTVKVGQDNMVTESDFEMYVYFSLTPFTIDDLVARFGPRVRILP